MISGFHHEVDEICALLGHYAVSSGNYLPAFFDPLMMGLIGCPKTWVRNYHYLMCNNPGEQFSEMEFVISLEWLLLQAAVSQISSPQKLGPNLALRMMRGECNVM
jgi:hypothetical protein